MATSLNRLRCFGTTGTSGTIWSEPLSLDNFGAEFRMPSGEKKGVGDERAEELFGGIQATGGGGVAGSL